MKSFKITFEKKTANILQTMCFLIIGLLLFIKPTETVKIACYLLGGTIIFIGISKILKYYQTLKKEKIELKAFLIVGIIMIVLGIIVIFTWSALEFLLRVLMGAWLIYMGIRRLMQALEIKKENSSIWIYLFVLSLVLLICGLYMIMNKNLILQAVGLFIIIYSIIEIIQVGLRPKNLNPDIIK
jgi:uncharacterized membrane protein HdeD (DUF308 family)